MVFHFHPICTHVVKLTLVRYNVFLNMQKVPTNQTNLKWLRGWFKSIKSSRLTFPLKWSSLSEMRSWRCADQTALWILYISCLCLWVNMGHYIFKLNDKLKISVQYKNINSYISAFLVFTIVNDITSALNWKVSA